MPVNFTGTGTIWTDSASVMSLNPLDANGQIYHKGQYAIASSYNHYFAKSTSSMSPTNSWQDTNLSWSGVYIPTNVKKVLLWFHLSVRNNGVSVSHSAFRMRIVRTSDSSTTYQGNASWGFGIMQCVGNTSGQNHFCINQHVNLLDYDSLGNQGGLTAGYTYNMYLQVLDAYGNGTTLRLAAEGDGTHQSYTPQHGMIWVI
jgi:hypothetical protein